MRRRDYLRRVLSAFRGENDEKRADDAERKRGEQQVGACGWKLDGHDRHDGGMREAS